ncbi:hypothetical protein ACFL0A_01275 [Patescibacteria group bacterium]
MKKFNNEKSFTIIELLVVMGLVVLLTSIILPDYRTGERQFALQESTHKLAQDLRKAQEQSMSMHQFNCSSGKLKGYGIRFEQDRESYSFRARCENGEILDIEEENIFLGEGVKIKELKIDENSINSINIFFYPPDPEIDFGGTNNAVIILCLKNDFNNTKTISINKAGLIAIE